MLRLFLLFTIVPTIELYILFRIAGVIGFFPTLWLVIGTGALGAALAKAEGLRILREWQVAAAQGRVPEDDVMSGVLLLVGGVLLITPGILTDLAGLALLFPPSRRLVASILRRELARRIERGQVFVHMQGTQFGSPFEQNGWRQPERDEEIIETSYKVLDVDYEEPPDKP